MRDSGGLPAMRAGTDTRTVSKARVGAWRIGGENTEAARAGGLRNAVLSRSGTYCGADCAFRLAASAAISAGGRR
jgi:hypothetical protein